MGTIFQKKRKKNVEKGQNVWKFEQKFIKFENVLDKAKGRWLHAIIANGNKLLEYAV